MSFTDVAHKEMGNNPAQVDRLTGELFVNPRLWDDMPETVKRFILLHEEGHLIGGPNGTPTADETAADLYAFRHFKNTEPHSLKNSVITLDILLGNSPQELKRKLLIYSAALLEDWQHNKNGKALVEYHNVKAELEELHGVSGLPQIGSNLSNIAPIIAIIGLALSAATTGLGMYAQKKAQTDAERAAEMYGYSASARNGNAILNSVINADSEKDKKDSQMLTLKYFGIISMILILMYLGYKYISKMK